MLNLHFILMVCGAIPMPTSAYVTSLSSNLGVAHHFLAVLLASAGGVGWFLMLCKLDRFVNYIYKVNADLFLKYPSLEIFLFGGEMLFFVIISPVLSGFIGHQGVKVVVQMME